MAISMHQNVYQQSFSQIKPSREKTISEHSARRKSHKGERTYIYLKYFNTNTQVFYGKLFILTFTMSPYMPIII